MADFLVVRLPHLLTPRTEMSRILPRVVFESFLQPPPPGQGLTVHSLADVSGGTSSDRAQMVDALTIADPALHPLEGPPDRLRVHVRYQVGALPPEAQAAFRFAGIYRLPTVWARVERGETTLRLLLAPATDAKQLAQRLKDFLGPGADAEVTVQAGAAPAEVARLQAMEAALAQVRSQGA